MTKPGYRERIYQQYVSAFKQTTDSGSVAREFARHAGYLDYLLGPIVERLHPKALLDVACGHGRVLYWAKGRGLTAAGFDISSEQVAVARSLGLSAEVAAAAAYLPAHPESADLITAFDIVEHFTRDEALEFLEQCRRCLRPGGVIVLTTPNGAGWRPGPVVHGDLTHETIFSPDTINLALRLSGFSDPEVRELAPAPLSIRSRVRRVCWSLVRLWPALLDLVEKGSSGGVYSRVMIATARR